jgi:hypothetical protein
MMMVGAVATGRWNNRFQGHRQVTHSSASLLHLKNGNHACRVMWLGVHETAQEVQLAGSMLISYSEIFRGVQGHPRLRLIWLIEERGPRLKCWIKQRGKEFVVKMHFGFGHGDKVSVANPSGCPGAPAAKAREIKYVSETGPWLEI